MALTRTSTNTPWERRLGYARAMRGGNLVMVSGTVASDDEGLPRAEDARGQTRAILASLDEVLRRLGSRLDHVLRLRVYHVDPAVGDGVMAALSEAFGGVLPAVTAVRVAGLVDPAFLVEIEADALVADWSADPDVPTPAPWDEGGD